MLKLNWKGLALLALATTAIVGCGKTDNFVTVNGEAVSKDDYIAYLERKNTVRIRTNQGLIDTQVAEPLSFQALRDLVNRKALQQLAKDEGVYPGTPEIEAELAFREKLNKGYLVKLQKEQGLTLQQIKNEVVIDLCQFRLITKGVKITDAQVDVFIKKNPTMFEKPRTADLLWVAVDSAKEQQTVDSELAAGQTFATVAMRYSKAPKARETRGMFPVNTYDQFPEALKKLVDSTAENQATGWVQEGNQRLKFFIMKKNAAEKVAIDDVMKERVRRQLALKKGAEGVDLNAKLLAKLKSANVSIGRSDLKTLWDNAVKNLKAEDVSPKPKTGEETTEAAPQG